VVRGSAIQTPLYAEDYCYAVHMPVELRLRLTLDSIHFCAHEMPKFHSFVEDTYYVSDGGPDAIDEMALGFVEIRKVVRDLVARGLDVDRFAPRIAILVNCRMDFFEEIAKIRATRRLFARMMRDELGARDPRSWAVNIAAHTSGLSLTAPQPVNNIVRGATQALALACAGVQALEVSTFDEAYRTPSPEAHRVGLESGELLFASYAATGLVNSSFAMGGPLDEVLAEEVKPLHLSPFHLLQHRLPCFEPDDPRPAGIRILIGSDEEAIFIPGGIRAEETYLRDAQTLHEKFAGGKKVLIGQLRRDQDSQGGFLFVKKRLESQ